MSGAVWWIRRDLRLADNAALQAAVQHGGSVIPLFIVDPALLESAYVGEKRLAFLWSGLRALDDALRARGSRLLVRRGDPVVVLRDVLAETGADAVYAEADYTPFAQRRDARVESALPLHRFDGLTVLPPGAVMKDDGTPYTVFTPFSKRWKAQPLPTAADVLPAPESLPALPDVPGDPIPDLPLPDAVPFPPGEDEAQRRLRAFTDGLAAPVYAYAEQRNRMDLAGTSALSPYLRFGMISARAAVTAARACIDAAGDKQARKGAETWLNELIWREFYQHILAHFPHVREMAFRADLRDIPWEDDAAALRAWQEGRTGYPVVDAAMRQLSVTGWMHNRARMITASFLTKDLLVNWQEGERWFMQHLVDGDAASNNGGWQWTAGTGTDAAPYFRIFNPVLQGEKFDPDGDFVRRWVPELADVPRKYLHKPWEMPDAAQRESGCIIGQDYPAPVVDHHAARERTLQAYKWSKDDS